MHKLHKIAVIIIIVSLCNNLLFAGSNLAAPGIADTEELVDLDDKFIVGIERSVFEKWAGVLKEKYDRIYGGENAEYPFSPHILGNCWAFFQKTISNIGFGAIIAGFRFNMEEADPGKRKLRVTDIGLPQDIVSARLLKIKGKKFSRLQGFGLYRKEEMVIPFVGGFYRPDGTEVTEKELNKLGLEWIKDKDGKIQEIPVFTGKLTPSRVITLPLNNEFFSFLVRENHPVKYIITIDDFEWLVREYFKEEVLNKLKAQAETRAKETAAGDDPLPDYLYKMLFELTYKQTMHAFLVSNNNGYKLGRMKAAALQYKGCGGNYICNVVRSDEVDAKHMREFKIVKSLDGVDNVKVIVDDRFEGKCGIILKKYQSSDVAINGASTEELDALNREKVMLSNGATLSTINIDTVEIIGKKELKQLGASDNLKPLVVSMRVVIDDTRSMGDVLGSTPYAEFIKDEYESIEDFEEAKDDHLSGFYGGLGRNIAAAIKSGYTLPSKDVGLINRMGFLRNVSPWGLLKDLGDYRPIGIPQDAMFVIKAMYDSALALAEEAGMDEKEFISSKYFDLINKAFLSNLGGSDEQNEKVINDIKVIKEIMIESKNNEHAYAYFSLLTRAIFTHWMSVSNIEDKPWNEGLFNAKVLDSDHLYRLSIGYSRMLCAIGFPPDLYGQEPDSIKGVNAVEKAQ